MLEKMKCKLNNHSTNEALKLQKSNSDTYFESLTWSYTKYSN